MVYEPSDASRGVVVLYHADCLDGMGACMAAYSRFYDDEIDASYLPVKYGQPIPSFDDGLDVYIVDFSYPRDVLEKLKSRCRKLVILDHHKSAEVALRGFEGAHFDLDKSGAVLSWEYFHGGEEPPMILKYVQDRDIWLWQMKYTKPVTTALSMRIDEKDLWMALMENYENYYIRAMESGTYQGDESDIPTAFDDLITQGESILTYQNSYIQRILKKVTILPVDNYRLGVVNSTLLVSEVGEYIYDHLDVDGALIYSMEGPTASDLLFSFRSARGGERCDCRLLAEKFGGGGHPGAAGCKVDARMLVKLYNGELGSDEPD